MPNDYEQLKMRVAELENKLQEFTNPAAYDAETVAALKAVLPFVQTQSTKTANSEDVSVNEAGSSSYTVLDDPDVFVSVVIDGTVYYLPAYTS